jgi:hypothetical protein
MVKRNPKKSMTTIKKNGGSIKIHVKIPRNERAVKRIIF